jgi:hypothetical protein
MLRPMRFAAPVMSATWPASSLSGIARFLQTVEIHLNILLLGAKSG